MRSIISLITYLGLVSNVIAQSTSTTSSSSTRTTSISSSTPTTTSTSQTTTTTGSSPTSSTITTSVILQFKPIYTMSACSTARIEWSINGVDPRTVNIDLYAVNIGVNQTIPLNSTSSVSPSSTTSSSATSSVVTTTSTVPTTSSTIRTTTPAISASTAAVARGLSVLLGKRADINMSITTDQPASSGFTWNSVTLPAGRYYILGVLNDRQNTTGRSGVFTVAADKNATCLAGSGTGSATSSRIGATSTGAGAGMASSASNGISNGAIAGIVVAVVAIIAIAVFGWLFLRRRKRSQAGIRGRGIGGPEMRQGQGKGYFDPLPSATLTSNSSQHRAQNSESGNGLLSGTSNGFAMGNIRRESDDKFGGGSDGHGLSEESYTTAPLYKYSETQAQTQTPRNKRDLETSAPRTPHNRNQSNSDPFATPLHTQPPVVPTSLPISSSNSSEEMMDEKEGSHQNQKTPKQDGSRSTSGSSTPAVAVGRSTSLRRKPVPSLGDELRGQLKKEEDRRKEGHSSNGGKVSGKRGSYTLEVDQLMR